MKRINRCILHQVNVPGTRSYCLTQKNCIEFGRWLDTVKSEPMLEH